MSPSFRLSFLSSILTPAFIVLSCSSLSERVTEKRSDQIDKTQESFLLAYQKAKILEKSDALTSCSLYTRLSFENFSLKNLSLIRSHLICPDPKTLVAVSGEFLAKEPWLANIELDRQIGENLKYENWKDLSHNYNQKAQRSDKPREKILLIQSAQDAFQKFDQKNSKTPLSAEDQAYQADLQARLYRLAPRLLPNPTESDWIRVGNDWLFQRQFAKGQDYLKKVFAGKADFSLEEKYQAYKIYRNSFKTEQKKEDYLTHSKEFAQWAEKQKKLAPTRVLETYITLARAEWTEGNVSAGKEALNRAEKLLKGKTSLEEIQYVRARMSEESVDLDGALAWLQKGEAQSRNRSAIREKILFSQAWLLRKKGEFAKAAESLLKLKNESLDPFDKNRYSFWLARSWKQSQHPDLAQKELQELILNDPLGYYGLMAYRETNANLPALKPTARNPAQDAKPKTVSIQDQNLIAALTFVDEPEILERFLDWKTLDLKNQSNPDPNLWLFFLKSYAKAGLFNPLFQQLGNLPADLKTKLLLENPELLFPRKFLELIQASAEKFNVKPELMLSIIRQESAFNPLARSGADALGLMQVIPSAAKQHEKETGLTLGNFEDLYKPEMNIPYGASILASLNKKYRNQFLLVAAAYNANDKAIASWLKTRLKDDPLEFIEDIPYEETRGYIKLVLRNFVFYSRLANPNKALPFPSWCLEDLQSFKISTN